MTTTHDSGARLIGAREAAQRLLYSEDGIARSWPDRAGPYRGALLELVEAVDEAATEPDPPLPPAAHEPLGYLSPSVPVYACGACGALTVDPEAHHLWHAIWHR